MGEYQVRVPLQPGQAVGHWRLGAVHEERYDVPDQPMQGKMDAFFFLAKDRNFIPHEYPCRTEFITRYRGNSPEPVTAFQPLRFWLPYDGPRIDLSGFWFRPTRVECWAHTLLESSEAKTARFRLATCGGALLLVNGEQAGAITRYQRNFEEAVEVDVSLKAGLNDVKVWFADLCERDARYYFSLELLQGEGLTVALPIPIPGDRAAEIGRMLESMRFERPSYQSGEVAVVFDQPAPEDLVVDVAVEARSIAVVEPFQLSRSLPAGDRRLVLGAIDTLPGDFRQFDFTVSVGGFATTRRLAVEIGPSDRQPEPSPDLTTRARQALEHVAVHGEPDAVVALARLAIDQGGQETDRILEACLPAIDDLYDCADFLLVPLLWCRMAWPERIGPETRSRIDRTILGFRYWMDEPGNDVMWYFSENHTLLFHTACHLAGTLLPGATFVRSGRSAREHAEIGRQRLLGWLDHFEAWEMAEWNSAPYFPIDLKGLCALQALSPDPAIRERAAAAIGRLLEMVALSSHSGLLTASQGRSYEHSLRPGRSLELSAIARVAFSRGWLGERFHTLPQFALCILEHGLTVDPRLASLADHRGEEAYEWRYKQGEKGIAALYHYKTRAFAMGSIAGYRWRQWGYQETMLHLRLGERPEAQIWINHPGEVIYAGYGRPSYWGGSGTIPRTHQYRALAVVDFSVHENQPDFTHAWLPEAEMDEVIHQGDRVLVRAGEGLCLLQASAPLQRVERGPMTGCELRLPGRQGRWIVRLSDLAREGSLQAFGERFRGLACAVHGEDFILTDPDYGTVRCGADAAVRTADETLDPEDWTMTGELVTLPHRGRITLPSQQGRADARQTA